MAENMAHQTEKDPPAWDDEHAVSTLTLSTSQPSSQTLLPPPFATAVSLFTATSSLSLRLGSLIGHLAINVGKITTLTGFEITRAILEGILARAGQDVVDSSRSQLGRQAAESLLERALKALHQLITTSSFLASAGFQVGSTSIDASLALGQSILSALDALFGDTETSKAIATIIVLVQREVSCAGDLDGGESVSLSDIFTSVVAFALLQKWGHRRSQLENEQNGSVEVIWDIVVLADPASKTATQDAVEADLDLARPRNLDVVRSRPQSSSFMSAHGDASEFQGISVDDSRSFVSTVSTRTPYDLSADNQLDHSPREHIMSQLTAGTNVKVSVQSMTVNSISIEIDHASENTVPDAPLGYSLVSVDDVGLDSRRIVYQNHLTKRKMGRFEVPAHGNLNARSLQHTEVLPSALADVDKKLSSHTEASPFVAPTQSKRQRIGNTSGTTESHLARATAPKPLRSMNETGSPAFPTRMERLVKVKDTLMQKKSYRNLVDFWNNTQPKKENLDVRGPVLHRDLSLRPISRPGSRPASPSRIRDRQPFAASRDWSSRPESPDLFRHGGENAFAPPTIENAGSLNPRDRSLSRFAPRHARSASVYSVVSAASESSMVLHMRPEDAGMDAVATSLARNGRLPSQYPQYPFPTNAIRYLRFSIASYGQSFLRILGTAAQDQNEIPDVKSSDPREHHSFTSYTRLPPSTVLLSSYVDPQGVPIVKDQPGAATVLVHYISLDHEAKAVVFTCRGTLGVEDILTDLTADYDDFYWQNTKYQAHQGILAAARKLLSSYNGRVMATIAKALEEFPEYGLVLCGHSLGGSVAAVLAVLLSEPNARYGRDGCGFVTKSPAMRSRLIGYVAQDENTTPNAEPAFPLPPGRPIHVYAYGPAAVMSPSLQLATRGLVTSIIHGQDSVSYLSLGTLRDFRSIALAFKADQGHIKNEIRRRIWDGLQKSFRDRNDQSNDWIPSDILTEDPWPWLALQGLRSNLDAIKLLPPGDVFHVKSTPVLQRHFVTSTGRPHEESRTFKPAKHVTVTHIQDVESQFREISFGPSMWFDHMPMRYEAVLETLEEGLT